MNRMLLAGKAKNIYKSLSGSLKYDKFYTDIGRIHILKFEWSSKIEWSNFDCEILEFAVWPNTK